MTLTRFEKICGSLNLQGQGVEIGPAYNPVLPKNQGYKVTVVDHLNSEEIREKYRNWNVDTSAIEEVDVVWKSGSLAAALKDHGPFDYILASHVIEHIPDPIRFLEDCQVILKPDGKLSLVVPDKRYCFDYYRQLTTTGEWIEAFLEKRIIHPPRKHFDAFAYAVTKGGAIAWGGGSEGILALSGHTLTDAYEQAQRSHVTGLYSDVHAWQFTPESFYLIIKELNHLSLISLVDVISYPTAGFEFFVTLQVCPFGVQCSKLSRADRDAMVSASYSPKL